MECVPELLITRDILEKISYYLHPINIPIVMSIGLQKFDVQQRYFTEADEVSTAQLMYSTYILLRPMTF
jgi:hypothetical protein